MVRMERGRQGKAGDRSSPIICPVGYQTARSMCALSHFRQSINIWPSALWYSDKFTAGSIYNKYRLCAFWIFALSM